MANFGIMGACGYIAPRHLQAIHETGNKLVIAYDPMDSVGILDKYSKNVAYFKTYEEFYYHIKSELKEKLDYISICSPNYLHCTQILLGLEMGAHVICEKPLVINPKDIDFLKSIELETGKKVHTILQLRLHDVIKNLKNKVAHDPRKEKFDLELTYITSRGPWYHQTWKSHTRTSGGIAANIGVHFFDMLSWIFGHEVSSQLHYRDEMTMSGYLELDRARIKWFLSIDSSKLPEDVIRSGKTTYRTILIDGEEIEFSEGFTDLHTKIYQDILEGRGYGLDDAAETIRMVSRLRDLPVITDAQNKHKFLK
jgi:UDP-N-acetyl-2-amino-2-deoxyglucuronate dehydrogenase